MRSRVDVVPILAFCADGRGLLAFALLTAAVAPASGQWIQMNGLARDIGIGGGSQWAIGTNPVGNDNYGVYKFNGTSWDAMAGGGVRIASGPAGHAWTVGAHGGIFVWVNGRSTDVPPLPSSIQAIDIAVSKEGTYVIGNDHQLWEFNPDFQRWDRANGPPVEFSRVTAGSHGGVRLVATTGAVYFRAPGQDEFLNIPGVIASDIGVGGNGAVWAIGRNPAPGNNGNEIYQWRGDSWLRMPGAAEQISVAGAGNAWVVARNGNIYQWPSNQVLPPPSPKGRIDFLTEAGYVARYSVSYVLDYGPRVSFSTGNLTAGRRGGFDIPRNATDIVVKGEGQTGLAWEPWRTTFQQSYQSPRTICFKSYGTTLSQKWNNDCAASVTKDDVDKVLAIIAALKG